MWELAAQKQIKFWKKISHKQTHIYLCPRRQPRPCQEVNLFKWFSPLFFTLQMNHFHPLHGSSWSFGAFDSLLLFTSAAPPAFFFTPPQGLMAWNSPLILWFTSFCLAASNPASLPPITASAKTVPGARATLPLGVCVITKRFSREKCSRDGRRGSGVEEDGTCQRLIFKKRKLC